MFCVLGLRTRVAGRRREILIHRLLGAGLGKSRQVGGESDSIGCQFRNGEPLERLVTDLCSGQVDHRTDRRMRIKVMEWPGRGYISMDNRRLHCFQHANCRVVRAQVWRLPAAFIDLVEHNNLMEAFLRKFDGISRLRGFGLGS